MTFSRLIFFLISISLISACKYDDYDSTNLNYEDDIFYSYKDSLLIEVIKNKHLDSDFCYLQISVQSGDKNNLKELKKYLRKSLKFSSKIAKIDSIHSLTFSTKAFRNSMEGILLSVSDMIYLSHAFDVLPTAIMISPSSTEMEIRFSGKDLYTQAWLKSIEQDYFYSYHYLIEYIERNPHDAKAYSLKAGILRNLDLELLTMNYLSISLEHDESDPNGLRSKAFILAAKGDTSAVSVINKFIEEDPLNPLGVYYQGLVKIDLGDSIGACLDLENYDMIDPDYEERYKQICQ